MTDTAFLPPAACCPRGSERTGWALLRQLYERIARWEKNWRDVRHLRGMTDSQLTDIGISRSEISSVIYGDPKDRVP